VSSLENETFERSQHGQGLRNFPSLPRWFWCVILECFVNFLEPDYEPLPWFMIIYWLYSSVIMISVKLINKSICKSELLIIWPRFCYTIIKISWCVSLSKIQVLVCVKLIQVNILLSILLCVQMPWHVMPTYFKLKHFVSILKHSGSYNKRNVYYSLTFPLTYSFHNVLCLQRPRPPTMDLPWLQMPYKWKGNT